MIFFLDFLFNLVFLFYKLYSLLNSNYIFQDNGSKLKRYISLDNLTNTTCSFNNTQNNHFLFHFISNISSSPKHIGTYIQILFFSTLTLIIKISLTYKFLISNFLFFNILGKNINLNYIFEEKIILLKFLYYISSFINFIVIYNSILKYYNKKNKEKNQLKIKKEKISYELNNIHTKIGITDSNEIIYINELGLYQNILITGSIGTGKTSSVISNITFDLISKNIGGLIIDVKGTYIKTIKKMLLKLNQPDRLLEISFLSDFSYNPLANDELSSYEMANRLIQVLELTSKNSNSDSYWTDKAAQYINALITLIKLYSDSVNFYEIHKLTTDFSYLEGKINIIKKYILSDKYDDKTLFEINSAITTITQDFSNLDERIKSIIISEVTRITNVFVNDYSIYTKFCNEKKKIDFNSNKIVVLSLNIGKYSSLLKIIATYLKLDFQSQIIASKNISPHFFICDEFQEFVNSTDANFFSISREYKCINVICMQSYTSLTNTLNNKETADVIIQNLVNKIWLRNDDLYTISSIIKQIGKIKHQEETISYSENSQNSYYNILTNNFKNYKSGLAKTNSFSLKSDYKYSENYFTTTLQSFEACCMLSDGNKSTLYDKVNLKLWRC